MTTPSGQISLSDVNTELGYSATALISMNDAAVRGLAGVPSGAISMANLQGKSNTFSFNLTSGTDLNLRTQALAAGWNGSSAVQATIPSGNTIQSSTTGGYALTINGSFPAGVTLINNGLIVGRGGNGGVGGTAVYGSYASAGSPGDAAGPAMLVSVAVTINNASGVIAGGGGGGGGGGAAYGTNKSYSRFALGGSGGGGGIGVSSGGAGGGASGSSFGNIGGNVGTGGTLTAIGIGGAAVVQSGLSSGAGGNGGSYGSTGASGGAGSAVGGVVGGGGTGGAAGTCLSGNANITWTAVGTRYGAIV